MCLSESTHVSQGVYQLQLCTAIASLHTCSLHKEFHGGRLVTLAVRYGRHQHQGAGLLWSGADELSAKGFGLIELALLE